MLYVFPLFIYSLGRNNKLFAGIDGYVTVKGFGEPHRYLQVLKIQGLMGGAYNSAQLNLAQRVSWLFSTSRLHEHESHRQIQFIPSKLFINGARIPLK